MKKKLAAITIYAAAMGYVESAVVIYIREMAFSDPRQVFPLVYLDPQIGLIEIGREAATVVMLTAVGYLAGRNTFQKWMFFAYAFAIWDIFYYIVLRLTVGWPASLLTFDVLFLIPVIWMGPVLTPILISMLLSLGSGILLLQSERRDEAGLNRSGLLIFIIGCAVVFYSFTQNTFLILFSQGPKGLDGYKPDSFDWIAFLVGYFTMCVSVFKMIQESQQKHKTVEVTK